MNRIRLYHAALAILALLSFITGEPSLIHAWLGYGAGLVILLRLLWALGGDKQFGLMRYYPTFEDLKLGNVITNPIISKTLILGIALCLIGATATGIVMDKGKSIGLANIHIVSPAYASDDGDDTEDGDEVFLEETHEFFANLMLLLVGMHVTYLLLYKLPLAKFMVFLTKPADRNSRN